MNTRKTKTADFLVRQRGYVLPATVHVPKAAFSDIRGFSLVELVVILVIIGILLVIALPTWSYMVTRAKVSSAQSDIRILEKEVTAYLIDKGTAPPSLNAIGRGNFLDPWKRPYQYVNLALGGPPYQDFLLSPLNTDFDLYSLGQDGISTMSLADVSCGDDIIRAGDGGFVGLGNAF